MDEADAGTTVTVTGTATGADAMIRGADMLRALDSVVRVMGQVVASMRFAADAGDSTQFERCERTYRAAEARYDELCEAARAAGYLDALGELPAKPEPEPDLVVVTGSVRTGGRRGGLRRRHLRLRRSVAA